MRQLGITYNAAWRMKHKLMQGMKERDDSRALEGIVQLMLTRAENTGVANEGVAQQGKVLSWQP
jgi:hypothetical protein